MTIEEAVKGRIQQACEEIHDQGVFTADQITTLQNAFIMIGWSVIEALTSTQEGETDG